MRCSIYWACSLSLPNCYYSSWWKALSCYMYIIVNILPVTEANLFKSTEKKERPKAFHGGCTVACRTMLDSIPRSSLVYPHLRHCIMCLTKTHLYLLTAGSTHEEPSGHNWKRVDWDVKNQIKQTNKYFHSKKIKNVPSVHLFTNWSFWQAFIIFFIAQRLWVWCAKFTYILVLLALEIGPE